MIILCLNTKRNRDLLMKNGLKEILILEEKYLRIVMADMFFGMVNIPKNSENTLTIIELDQTVMNKLLLLKSLGFLDREMIEVIKGEGNV